MAEVSVPLLDGNGAQKEEVPLLQRTLVESKKLWRIAGPAIFTRLATYGMNVVTQAFVGHLGDLDLAAVSIASTVIVGFNFGLLLGMASALETLCGQAFGARRYSMLGVYLQRSFIIMFIFAVILLPMYIFATPILKFFGQTTAIAELSGSLAIWFIPQQFAFVLLFPLQRFLQCQLKNIVIACVTAIGFSVHCVLSWLLIDYLDLGLVGAAVSLNIGWWLPALGLLLYVVCGGCPQTWTGFSREAFAGLWEFLKLSIASGVMICLGNWYYRILVLLAGTLKNAEIAVDALSICMNINGWEYMIPIAFLAATGVRVSVELGAGNAKGAKFATVVSAATSTVVGIIFWILIIVLHNEFFLVFTSSTEVLQAASKLAILLAFTILLNSIQPVLSGVAVGSGWQAFVAYINIGCYYLVGVPVGAVLCWVLDLSVLGLWSGMIGGTAVQTLILGIIVIRCDWEKEAQKARSRVSKWSTTPIAAETPRNGSSDETMTPNA
ncbi:protein DETOXIFICATION 27-like isoform X1 [Nymphaea colorata]|nr:protein DETOXIFICATION 27-like isoform X1 [Nymphaea colorata]